LPFPQIQDWSFEKSSVKTNYSQKAGIEKEINSCAKVKKIDGELNLKCMLF
jgi:hypothetical protein